MALKKKFFDIDVPLMEESISVLGSPETLAGKTIKIDLSRKLRGKSLEAVLKIYNKNGLYALPKSLNLMNFYIRRMMRKRISYVEDSFVGKCKDISVTIKPFLITRKRVSRAVRANLRKTSKEFILEYIKDKNYLDVCKELLIGQIQKDMLPKLKKIYPLSFCEIRVFETKEIDSVVFDYQKKEKAKIEAPKELVEEKIEEEKKETKKEEKIEEKVENKAEDKPKKEKKEKKTEKKVE